MGVDKVEPRCGSPVAKQPRFDVFRLQWFVKEGIVEQIDLTDRQIVRGAPVPVEQIQIAVPGRAIVDGYCFHADVPRWLGATKSSPFSIPVHVNKDKAGALGFRQRASAAGPTIR